MTKFPLVAHWRSYWTRTGTVHVVIVMWLSCDRQLKLELIETQADRDSAVNKIDRYKARREGGREGEPSWGEGKREGGNSSFLLTQRAVERKKNRDAQTQAIQFMSSEKLSGQDKQWIHDFATICTCTLNYTLDWVYVHRMSIYSTCKKIWESF